MCVLESTETPSFVQRSSSVYNDDDFGITSIRYPSTDVVSYKRSRTLKNIGCRYIQMVKLNRNMRSRVSTRFCINFVFERAVPFSYRVIYTFPVYCHCRRRRCCCCRCSVVLWMFGRCWVFFFVVFFHALVRSFKILFALLLPHSFAAFIRFSMLVLFLFSSVSFHFILSSFLSPFPSPLLLLLLCYELCVFC